MAQIIGTAPRIIRQPDVSSPLSAGEPISDAAVPAVKKDLFRSQQAGHATPEATKTTELRYANHRVVSYKEAVEAGHKEAALLCRFGVQLGKEEHLWAAAKKVGLSAA